MDDCIFCKIAGGKIPCSKIWEDEGYLAFLDINPINTGHTLVIPKKHQDHVFDMDDPDYEGLFRASKKVANLLKKSLGTKRVGVIVEGFLVRHAHVHLIPMNGPEEFSASRARRASPEELDALAAKIRRQL